ncbi:hypothetical protein [Pseudomonas sp. NPDC008258]|uniref:hypothetical protein n=1 Tax=Pseudomonas sp. NPDC008258 TaxID=3364418 RepID=UPI0036EF8165
MNSPETRTFAFAQAVAKQFAGRPTLRQVASEQLLAVLLAELPWLADVTPALSTAEPLMLDSPDPDTPYWTTQPLLDRVLQALLDPQLLDIEPLEDGRHFNVGLTAPYRFAGSHSELDTRRLTGLSRSLNELVARLPQSFCEAQLEYWKAQGSAGVSRDSWLQLVLQTALLRGLPMQGLDAQEQACIRGVIRGQADQPSVCFVEAQLTSASQQYDEMLCHLLVLGEWDERQVALWCEPSGTVRSFESLGDFGYALRDELAQRYAFEQMSWRRYPVQGNAFAQQVSLLLETVFRRVDRASFSAISDVGALEQRFAELSDPSSWFVDYENQTPAVQPPLGLRASSAQDSFAWSAALLQIAAYQLDADGIAALEGVQSLQAYTRQQLAEQIRLDHADEGSADNVLLDLYLARGMPGGGATGAGGGEPLAFVGSKTLTEFAIGNLSSLKGAVIRNIRHSDGSELPAWLNPDSVRRLVLQVDIGGGYPAYVAEHLDDPATRADRVRRFGREWRSALLCTAVTAKLEQRISQAGLQCIVDFCAGHLDPVTPRVMLVPLAFKRSPASRNKDQVRGMFMLYCAEPSLVLLYRPLFAQDTLREYASLPAVLDQVRESQLLQDSIVDWMDPAVRAIYQNGGFQEPHIAVIGIDFYAPPATPEPASLSIEFWRNDLDERLYAANRDLLVELANEQSVSNAESRWQTLSEGAWLLFDVVTLVIRGPAASMAWLVQLLGALENDLDALEQGDEFARSAAIADLMLNLGMSLLHARQPVQGVAPAAELPDASVFERPAAQRGAFAESTLVPVNVGTGQALAALPGRWLDFSWRGQSGLNWLPPAQRQALHAMRSNVALNGLQPLTTQEARGLYLIDGHYYAALGGDAYRVEQSPAGVRVVDPRGTPGPWIVFDGVWRVDASLRLEGGMKQSGTRARLANRFHEMKEKVGQLDLQVNEARDRFGTLAKKSLESLDRLQSLKALRAKAAAALLSPPEGADVTQMQGLLQRYDDRIAEWEVEDFNRREESVQQLEAAVRAEQTILPLLTTMKEPKFAAERLTAGWDASIEQHEKNVRTGLIRNNNFIVKELWDLADYEALAEMRKRLNGRPIVEVSELYKKLRLKLETVAGLQDRILLAQEHLDELLAVTADDFEISSAPEEPAHTVGQLIASRHFTTVQLRFHQVLNLSDLALHLDSETGIETLVGYREELAGLNLRSAADAHGELDVVTLSAQDRVVILQEAWDEYTAALLNSARIRKTGGKLIEPGMIDRYQEHVGKLKLDAGRRLVEAVREQETGTVPDRRSPYSVASTQQRLVRNAQGQLLIGTETEVEGQSIVEVRESFSDDVLATFEQVQGQWCEREAKRPSLVDQAPPDDLPMWVQSLLEENTAVREKARSYVENDIKGSLLAQLFDQQLNKLDQAASVVRDAGGNESLLRTLERDADALRAEKKLQLTTLYTDTSYPSADALQFLHAEGVITVEYNERRTMQDGSAFDEYKVLRLPSRRNLWAAHFHFSSPDDYAQDFTTGHLKTWSQRRMSRRLAAAAGQRLHYGKLTLEQARGIIPF